MTRTMVANGTTYEVTEPYSIYCVAIDGIETTYPSEEEVIKAYKEAVSKLVAEKGTGYVELIEYLCGNKIVAPMDWFAEWYNNDEESHALTQAHTTVKYGEVVRAWNMKLGTENGRHYIMSFAEAERKLKA